MYFDFNGITYYAHIWYKDYYKKAIYIYYKDGDLLFIDYNSKTVEEAINKFKILKKR